MNVNILIFRIRKSRLKARELYMLKRQQGQKNLTFTKIIITYEPNKGSPMSRI